MWPLPQSTTRPGKRFDTTSPYSTRSSGPAKSPNVNAVWCVTGVWYPSPEMFSMTVFQLHPSRECTGGPMTSSPFSNFPKIDSR